MRSSNSGGRWKKIVVGLLIAGIATFVAAYYLPLHRAHEALNSQHRTLSQKAEVVEKKLNQVVTELKSTTSRRDELESERQTRDSKKKSQSERLTGAKSELSSKFEKHEKKGLAAVSEHDGRLVLALDESLIFAAQKADVSPKGKSVLCDVAKASGSRLALRASAYVAGVNGAAPKLPPDFPSVWSFSAARAASAAQTLEKCGVATARLTAVGNGIQKTPSSEVAKKLPSRLEIEILSE